MEITYACREHDPVSTGTHQQAMEIINTKYNVCGGHLQSSLVIKHTNNFMMIDPLMPGLRVNNMGANSTNLIKRA